MAPKKNAPAKKDAPKKTNAPKKGKKDQDDDDLLLNAAMAESAVANKKAAEDKKVADKKKAEKERQAEALERRKLKAMSALPAVYVNDVTKFVYEKWGGNSVTWRDQCWLAYTLNNFFCFVLETKRKLMIKTEAHPEGEAVETFVVHDLDSEEGSPHSWNVFTTANEGVYTVDLAVKQFLPKGRYGYRQDDLADKLGDAVVPGPSRIYKEKESENKDGKNVKIHQGVVALDGGILPAEGAVKVKDGVAEGGQKKYMKFLSSCRSGRYTGLNLSEEKSARILNKNKPRVCELSDSYEQAIEQFYDMEEVEKTIAAIEKKISSAAASEKKE